MAESQIAGLFMTPEMYRQQQMQADRMRAMEYAQLAPEQRAAMGFFSAGQGLGRAAGTLLGAQDPQLQQITEQQRLLQGLDVADPDSLMNAARQASQAGNVPLAMQLAQQANQANQARDLAEQRQYQLAQLQAQEQQRRAAAAAQRVGQGALQMSPATIQGLPVSESMPLRDDEGNLMPGAVPGALNLNVQAVAPMLAAMGPEGIAVLNRLQQAQKSMQPETVRLGRGERLFSRDASGALTPVQMPGQEAAANVGNPIQALIQGNAIHPSILPLANLYAARFTSLDPEDQAKALESLTVKNNAALEAAGRRDERKAAEVRSNAASELTQELTRLRVAEAREKREAGARLTPAAQKDVNDAATASANSQQNAARYTALADGIASAGGGYGSFTSAAEWLRANTGNQNALTELRQTATRIINESAIKSLPPGPATDKDIQIALSGMPRANADAQFMASFLRGLAKVENINSQVNAARADWLSNNNGSLGRASAAFPAGQFSARQGETWADFSARLARQLADQSRSPLSRAVDQIPGANVPTPSARPQQTPTMNAADAIIKGNR